MRFLFISKTGGQMALATRVSDEGHYTTLSSTNNIGGGLVRNIPYLPNLSNLILNEFPDLVVFDNPTYGKLADNLRTRGIRTLFTSNWSNVLNTNPEYNRMVVKTLGFENYDKTKEGYPITIEGWFNGNKFITGMLAYVYRRLFPENIGPSVDCMGSVVYGKFNKGKLYKQTLKNIEVPLRKVDYRGPISLDVVINSKGFSVKQLYAQPRRGTTTALFEGTKSSVGDVLFALATGEGINNISVEGYYVL